MLFLHEYIARFREEESNERKLLADALAETKQKHDVFQGGNPRTAFEDIVERYNWLGALENKRRFGIDSNLARNLPGALMQDYFVHLAVSVCLPYPRLQVFTEVKVPFGTYPLWERGELLSECPSERSDIAVGYLLLDGNIVEPALPVPRPPVTKLNQGESVAPLVTINTKIRVSQSEFFDWLGREQLMTKGNPHCLSVQVALRKEMDYTIVEAAQASEKFFLLGQGGERNVLPDRSELERFIDAFSEHLAHRMK